VDERDECMHEANAILVTGSHRSGSTWVGKTLALSPAVGYIGEPFGLHHRPGQFAANFSWWFPYINSENEESFVAPVLDMLSFRYRTDQEMRAIQSPRDAARLVLDRIRFERYRRNGVRPLLKDPLAVFSAEWLASRFRVQPVVLIRHPAAFVSSLKRLGWLHPFDHFLAQPLLMRDMLSTYQSIVEEFAALQRPLVEQAILLWKLIHHTILQYRKRHPEWIFVRHEDLSRNPLQRFEEIFSRLGLSFTERIRARILQATSDTNQAEPHNHMQLNRASRAGIWNWRQRLSEKEIDRIRTAVEPVSREFYDDADWGPACATPSRAAAN
jgi:Sulfotransferase family